MLYNYMKAILSIFNYINWYAFFLSFIVGLFVTLQYKGEPVKIFIYPTYDNKSNIQVKDHTGTCFTFDTEEVKCPEDNKIIDIPIQ
tara:strand:+ start:839 stop:1096 length:258 start_codon:yes stop_codon:yes gene_type:complete